MGYCGRPKPACAWWTCAVSTVFPSHLLQVAVKNGGMDVSDARRLRQPEKENARLKKMVADQALDISILKDVLSKNF